MKNCQYCFSENEISNNFCTSCGKLFFEVRAETEDIASNSLVHTDDFSILDNRYIIQKELGKGGMGKVYLAIDQRLENKLVAIKEVRIVDNDENKNKVALESFKKEASVLISIKHKNMPIIYDLISVTKDNLFIVMEYIDGVTLQNIMDKRGPIKEKEVLNWAIQLSDILWHLHRQKPPIIYRDTKPSNIMLDKQNQIKLVDFGIARHYKSNQNQDTCYLGSMGFAAPEQFGKEQSTVATDMYAFGATLHYLLTGESPSNKPFKFDKISNYTKVDKNFEELIIKCVELNPINRYSSFKEIIDTLKTISLRLRGDSNILPKDLENKPIVKKEINEIVGFRKIIKETYEHGKDKINKVQTISLIKKEIELAEQEKEKKILELGKMTYELIQKNKIEYYDLNNIASDIRKYNFLIEDKNIAISALKKSNFELYCVCGKAIKETQKFCDVCGERVNS